MEYHTLSLAELKTVARDHRPRIKQYYIKSKCELIQLLTMTQLPEAIRVEKMKIGELREEAKKQKIPGAWKLRRGQLIALLYPSPHKDNQNDDHTQKHNDPQTREREDVRVDIRNDLC